LYTVRRRHALFPPIYITADARKAAIYTPHNVQAYERFAHLATQALKDPTYQRFLCRVITREQIVDTQIAHIHVKTFPHVKSNGRRLVGRSNGDGEIALYPQRLRRIRTMRRRWGIEASRLYVKSRARAALLHELLHLKYRNREQTVRALTRRYFRAYQKRIRPENDAVIMNTLFPAGEGTQIITRRPSASQQAPSSLRPSRA
jgi:hypothetical protein